MSNYGKECLGQTVRALTVLVNAAAAAATVTSPYSNSVHVARWWWWGRWRHCLAPLYRPGTDVSQVRQWCWVSSCHRHRDEILSRRRLGVRAIDRSASAQIVTDHDLTK